MVQLSFIANFELVFDTLADTYLGPWQTSMMKHFCENMKRRKAVNYFHKNASPKKLHWVLNTPLTLVFDFTSSKNSSLKLLNTKLLDLTDTF